MLDDKDDVDFPTLAMHIYGVGVNDYIGGIYPVTVICYNGVTDKTFNITIGAYFRSQTHSNVIVKFMCFIVS